MPVTMILTLTSEIVDQTHRKGDRKHGGDIRGFFASSPQKASSGGGGGGSCSANAVTTAPATPVAVGKSAASSHHHTDLPSTPPPTTARLKARVCHTAATGGFRPAGHPNRRRRALLEKEDEIVDLGSSDHDSDGADADCDDDEVN